MWPFEKKFSTDRTRPQHHKCSVCGTMNHRPDMAEIYWHEGYGFHTTWGAELYVCKTCIAGSEYDRRLPGRDRRKPKVDTASITFNIESCKMEMVDETRKPRKKPAKKGKK